MHWTWVLCLLVAWWTHEETGPTHANAGYCALALVALRVLMGFYSRFRYVRFEEFVRSRRATWRYVQHLRSSKAPRFIGHNPLGGWMVLALLATVALLGLTGWLGTTDYLWGYAWVVQLHAALAWMLLGLMAIHITGVVFTGIRHQENLVMSMITGRKRSTQRDDRTSLHCPTFTRQAKPAPSHGKRAGCAGRCRCWPQSGARHNGR